MTHMNSTPSPHVTEAQHGLRSKFCGYILHHFLEFIANRF